MKEPGEVDVAFVILIQVIEKSRGDSFHIILAFEGFFEAEYIDLVSAV